MKKILLLALTVFSMSSLFSQSQRSVFIEEFTQASCPPCEVSTPMLNEMITANIDKIVQIRYHTSWPGVDPMNSDNPTEVQDRVNYYSVGGVPSLMLDGAEPVGPEFPELVLQENIDIAYANPSPVAMALTHTLADDLSSASVTLTITNEGTEAYNVSTNRLRVAFVEEEITWSAPPGSTSLTVFEAVMKGFITGTAGMMIPEIAPGETWTNTWEDIDLPRRIYNFRELGVVAFIQDDSNRSVVQSAHSLPIEIGDFADLSVFNAASSSDDLCDFDLTPSVLVSNNGDIPADGYSVDFVLNGAVIETVTSENTLAGGESELVNFNSTVLPGGTSVYGYIITGTGGDISTANNFSNAALVNRANPVESINRGFENEVINIGAPIAGTITSVPNALLNFTTVTGAVFDSPNRLGGYGESDVSMSVNFYQWELPVLDPNGSMTLFDYYEVPENGAEFSFDYAYTSWNGSEDRLIIEFSTDCGETFTEKFNEAGSDLATAPEVNADDARFVPSADDWETVKIDLSEFANETILVRFRVVSAWGDMLYIDNIALNMITSLNELNAEESLNVFPNPASTYVNLELTTPDASNVQLSVIDMVGRVIKTENLGAVRGKQNHTLDIASIQNGSYIILMNVDGREVVEKLTIAH